ncbi:MAG: class II aldolase/adducin family protein [Gammaproteobacteria bacterium]|jgi:L-fuculose-phosphate aldolase
MNLHQKIIETAKQFNVSGLSVGTSGNLSARTSQGYLITPSGIPYHQLKEADIVEMDLQGNVVHGDLKPSSEWHFHQDIYLAREEINAIVHVHSDYATGIACTRQDIPAFHYMVARAGGDSIRCAEYATFGTDALSQNAVKALQGRNACLLANHGMIALGESIDSAYKLAEEIENIAKQYYISKQLGEVVLLDGDEMKTNLEKFKTYGKQ